MRSTPTMSKPKSHSSLAIRSDRNRVRKAKKAQEAIEMKKCFSVLRDLVPTIPQTGNISTSQFIGHVIDYIDQLEMTLQFDDCLRLGFAGLLNGDASSDDDCHRVPSPSVETSIRKPLGVNNLVSNVPGSPKSLSLEDDDLGSSADSDISLSDLDDTGL